jgi:hypothetical protein
VAQGLQRQPRRDAWDRHRGYNRPRVLENNAELAYEGLTKAVRDGNAYAFQVLAGRGYGKLKETHEHEHREAVELTLAQVNARILEIVAGQKTNAKTTQVTAISRLTVHS